MASILFVAFVSLTSTTGASETCYEARPAPANGPSYLCFSSVYLDESGSYLRIKGTAPSFMRIVQSTEKEIKAEGTLFDNWDNSECAEGEVSILKLILPQPVEPIDIGNLNLSIAYTYWANTCRFPTSGGSFKMVRVK